MSKRIFVIGAVGSMCIEATRDFIENTEYDEYMLADQNIELCQALAKEYAEKNIKTLKVDARNFEDLCNAFKGYDFVMNGLSFGVAEPSIKACIELKIPTILLDDFPRDYYYEGFEKAGVLCTAGVGMTPGMTDMMARWAVDRLDAVKEINVSWASFRPIALSPGLVLTTFWEMHPEEKDRAYYENGKMHPQPPLKESKKVNFADPFGTLDVYYVPHPETVRFAQFVPNIEKVVTMGTWPPIEMELLKQLIDFGVFDQQQIKHKGIDLSVQDVIGDLLHQLPRGTRTELWGYALNVETIGEKDGRAVRYVLKTHHPYFTEWGGPRAYAKNVAIPMAIGAQLMLNGQVKHNSGYHIAYEVFEPAVFFQEMEKRQISTTEEVFIAPQQLGKSTAAAAVVA